MDSNRNKKRRKTEFKLVVFNAARDGKLYRLKVFLDHKPKDEVFMLVSVRTNGSTPLLMACINGHLDVVVYLIDKCNADIEQVGSVTFDGETIEGAPPLWCAAASGHLNIVKILIKYNASINSTTKTNSTPLRAACFDGHLDIAKYLIQHGADIEIPNRHGHTSLMIACYKGHYEISKYLVECGVDVNKKSFKGNTALHDCAESGCLKILKMLLKHGAKFEADSSGTTPLLSAAINGHSLIVEYFINEYNCTMLEKINALELLGATILDKKRDMINALTCWKRAMQLRYKNKEFVLENSHTKSSIASYVGTIEVHTFQQLEELISDPDEMRMQALLIRERILGPGHPDNVYYIRYRGATYADNGNFEKCILLWMYALDVLQRLQEPLNQMTLSSLLAFAELFSYMMSKAGDVPTVSFKDIFYVFEITVKEIERALKLSKEQNQDLNECNSFHRALTISLLLVGLMCKLQPNFNENEQIELKKGVYQLVHLNPKSKHGWTPLHLACFKDPAPLGRYPVFTFPSPEVVDLLLEVGACLNAVDSSKNTPLHIAAMNKPCASTVFRLLLSHGAHLDFCNYDRQTPLQLAQHTVPLDVYPLHYLSLKCLSAKVIRRYGVPYAGLVHRDLKEFIDSH